MFDEGFAERFPFDVLDATKIVPEEEVPVRRVGRLVLDRMPDNFFAETEQVAFCTQNVVPGIDFTNDPLLQGRNFSYLDTQLKRLGGPNFTHLPVNAPRCPFHHLQQDGHMAMHNPKGWANYEPNSWGGAGGGPREDHDRGFASVPEREAGEKQRSRSESFADHYSQARQFYLSQHEIERRHIADALTFELSKVERAEIRERMVAHLLNVDAGLAHRVADGLGMAALPEAAAPAREPVADLPESPALSILRNGPGSFAGRRVGALVSDGVDAGLLQALRRRLEQEGAELKIVAPRIGGVQASDGSRVAADAQLDGGPSVLFDAVALLLTDRGAGEVAALPAARDFLADAFAHYKLIAHTEASAPLLEKAGLTLDRLDNGFVALAGNEDVELFVKKCGALRFWDRAGG